MTWWTWFALKSECWIDIELIHQRIRTTRSHTPCCRHCHYDFVLFHNATHYKNCLSSRVHVNTRNLHDITCTLVAPSMISGGGGGLVRVNHHPSPLKKPHFIPNWSIWHTYDNKFQLFDNVFLLSRQRHNGSCPKGHIVFLLSCECLTETWI